MVFLLLFTHTFPAFAQDTGRLIDSSSYAGRTPAAELDEANEDFRERMRVLRSMSIGAQYQMEGWFLPSNGVGHFVGLSLEIMGYVGVHVSVYLPSEVFSFRARLGFTGWNVPLQPARLAVQLWGMYVGIFYSMDVESHENSLGHTETGPLGPLFQLVPFRFVLSPALIRRNAVSLCLSVAPAVSLMYLVVRRNVDRVGYFAATVGLQVELRYAFTRSRRR